MYAQWLQCRSHALMKLEISKLREERESEVRAPSHRRGRGARGGIGGAASNKNVKIKRAAA